MSKNKKEQTQKTEFGGLLRFYFKYAFPGIYKYIFLYMGTVVVVGMTAVLWPIVERLVISTFENATVGPDIMRQILPGILAVVAMNMGFSTIEIMYDHAMSMLKPMLQRNVSERLTDYVHSQSMSFWTTRMAGSVSTNITYCSTGAWCIVSDVLRSVTRVVTILLNSFLLFTVNMYIAVTFIIMFTLRLVVILVLKNKIKETAEKSAEETSRLNGKIMDGFVNQNVVKLFSNVAAEHDYLVKPRATVVDTSRMAAFMQRMSWALTTYFWDLMFGATLVLCGVLYGRGLMRISDIVYSMSVYFSVMGSIANLIDSIPVIMDSMASANKGYKNLVVPIDITDKQGATDLVVRKGKIEFRNISFKYKNKRKYVLKDFSLTIQPGERVGLVGVSGAGKTTVVNLLMRFYDVTRGEILIDGVDIRDITQKSLRENISFIPQEANMFNRTIRENIAYGNENATDAQIQRAAVRASAHKFIMSTEKKYNSFVGDRGIKLSGGQKQRIAIARAFLKQSPILILDEATSALDSETEVAIQKSFEQLSHNRTTIVIAHRLSTLRNMDRIVVMDNGHIVESGTHKALLKKRGVYAKLWNMQSGGFLQEE